MRVAATRNQGLMPSSKKEKVHACVHRNVRAQAKHLPPSVAAKAADVILG